MKTYKIQCSVGFSWIDITGWTGISEKDKVMAKVREYMIYNPEATYRVVETDSIVIPIEDPLIGISYGTALGPIKRENKELQIKNDRQRKMLESAWKAFEDIKDIIKIERERRSA